MPDPFSTLPLPLPTIILSGLEDLGTLHCLLQASSAVHAIFAMQYCEITESILSNFLPQLRQLLRVVVYIRSQSSNIRRQSDCIDAYNDFRGAYILAPNAGVSPLAKSTATLGAVRSLVQTASHVQNLAASFFVAHLERVNKIKPYRSLDGAASRDDQWTAIPGPMVIQYDIMECGSRRGSKSTGF